MANRLHPPTVLGGVLRDQSTYFSLGGYDAVVFEDTAGEMYIFRMVDRDEAEKLVSLINDYYDQPREE